MSVLVKLNKNPGGLNPDFCEMSEFQAAAGSLRNDNNQQKSVDAIFLSPALSGYGFDKNPITINNGSGTRALLCAA